MARSGPYYWGNRSRSTLGNAPVSDVTRHAARLVAEEQFATPLGAVGHPLAALDGRLIIGVRFRIIFLQLLDFFRVQLLLEVADDFVMVERRRPRHDGPFEGRDRPANEIENLVLGK